MPIIVPCRRAVKRQSGLVDAILGGHGANGQETGADPFHQVVAGHGIAADDDHPPAATAANPILGQGDPLRRAGTGGIDLRIGPARADILRELAVAHGQNAE